MIGNDVFILPDTGEQFTACLKTAALYSEHIFCLSSIAPRMVQTIFGEERKPGEPTLRYLEAARAHEPDFALLEQEGILERSSNSEASNETSPSDEQREQIFAAVLVSCFVRYELAKRLVRAGKIGASFLEESGRNKAMRLSPPSLWHALQDQTSQIYAETVSSSLRRKLTPEIVDRAIHDLYLKIITDAVDSTDVVLLTYSDIYEQSLSAVRLYPSLASVTKSEQYVYAQVEEHRRRAAGTKLAHTLLSRRLPRAHDLPLEDVLELRRKHRDELGAFRVGLGEVTAQVDLSKPVEQDNTQLQQLIRTKVDPALEDLKAAVRNSRVDMLKTLYAGKETAAGATVAAAISVMTHATTPGKLAASAVGMILFPALSALMSGRWDRKKLTNANRWSFLLEVEKLG